MTTLANAYDPAHFRQQGHALIDQLADYLQAAQQDQLPVTRWQEPADQLAFWQADFAQPDPASPTELFQHFIDQSIHLHHPHFLGHQVSVPLPMAALTGLLTGLLNNGNAVYEMGQTATSLERIVTDWLARRVGYDETSSGIITSGGTLANLTALLAARAARTDVWEQGHGPDRLAVLVSEEAHYCVDRAARIMGLGSEGVIKLPTDDQFRVQTDGLDAELAAAQARGLTVFAVVGSACTTSTGTYDNLVALSEFARRNGLWFHVDGAHGGAVVLSKQLQPLVRGIDQADSVVIDFHKMLMMPALNTALLFRRGADSYQVFQQRAQYLWSNQQSTDWFTLGKRTFECTKTMMSLNVYATLRLYGEDLFRQNVELLYDLGQQFARQVQARPDLELAIWPDANIVCFRYAGPGTDPTQLNEVNAHIRQQMLAEGRFYIVQTVLRGQTYLRVSLMNPGTARIDLTALLDEVTHIGARIMA